MSIEGTGQRLGQVGDLAPHLSFGQVGEGERVGLTLDHRGQDRPGRHCLQTRRDRGQLDGGVFQHQLQPDNLTAPVSHQLHPIPGQHPQPADLWWWHERRRQQPVLQQLGDPLRVPDVALAARHRLHVGGVEQPYLHDFFQAVERRLPIRRRRLHRRDAHPGLDQPVPHHPQRPSCRLERARLAAPATAWAGRADADRQRLLADIQTGDPVEHDLHESPFPSVRRPSPHGVGPEGPLPGHRPACSLGNNPAATETPASYTCIGLTPHQCVSTSPADPPILISQCSDSKSATDYTYGDCNTLVNQFDKAGWGAIWGKAINVSGPTHDWSSIADLAHVSNHQAGTCPGQISGKSLDNMLTGRNLGPDSNYVVDLGAWRVVSMSSGLWRYETSKASTATGWLDTT